MTNNTDTPSVPDINNAVNRLAMFASIEYDKVRLEEAKSLNIRVSTLDIEVKTARKRINQENSTSSIISAIEPWQDKVEGGQLLTELQNTFNRYSVIPDGAEIALPLWVLGTYVFNAFRIYPMLGLSSPEKRCGKSTVMSLLRALSNRAILTSNISPAAIYRVIEKWQPTLLIDEADTFLKDNDELRGIINSGHTKDSAFVIRTVGDDHEPKEFSTWAPKAIAMIGDMSDTNRDRSILITMRRRKLGEKINKIRLDFGDTCLPLREKCLRWAVDNQSKLLQTTVTVPDLGNDRAVDNWEPLLAIAEIIGGEWKGKAVQAMQTILGNDEEENIGPMLLNDIKEIFEDENTDRIFSERLVNTLIELEDRPWCEWRRGNPITKTSLSKLLKPYNLHPHTLRIGADVKKGYKVDDFQDAFSRYLSPEPLLSENQTVTPLQTNIGAVFGGNQTVTKNSNVTAQKSPNANTVKGCNGVTDENGNLEGIKEIHRKEVTL